MNASCSGCNESFLPKPSMVEYIAAVRVDRQDRASAYGFAVKQQRASAADLNIAAKLGSGKAELLAHHIEQRRARFDFDAPLIAVNRYRDRFFDHQPAV